MPTSDPAPTGIAPAGDAASTVRMLSRGAIRRCPRCGAGHLFTRWVHLAERCPRCEYCFAREDGFFLGAFVINFGVTTVGLAMIMGGFIAVLAGGGAHRTIVAVAVIAGIEVIVAPVAFYPFAKTLWTAIDMAMHRHETWARVPPATAASAPMNKIG